jgi:hypothetical protein
LGCFLFYFDDVEYGNWLAGNYTLGNELLMSVKFRIFKKLSGLPFGEMTLCVTPYRNGQQFATLEAYRFAL